MSQKDQNRNKEEQYPMGTQEKKLHNRQNAKKLINFRRSLHISEPLLSILIYQQRMIMKHRSLLSWFCGCCYKFDTHVLEKGFKAAYSQLPQRDRLMYYQTTVKLAKQIINKSSLKGSKNQDRPKYSWQKDEQLETEPYLPLQIFYKVNIYYYSQEYEEESEQNYLAKHYVTVISAKGNYFELKQIQAIRTEIQLRESTKSISSKKKQGLIILDLRQYLLSREKNMDNQRCQLLILTKFVNKGRKGYNRVNESSDQVQKIYIQITQFYTYKTTSFIEFYLYSFEEYLRFVIGATSHQAAEIILKTSPITKAQEKIALEDHVDDQIQQLTGRPLLTTEEDGKEDYESNQNENNYLFIKNSGDTLENDKSVKNQLINSKDNQKFHRKLHNLWVDWKKSSNGMLTYKNQEKLYTQRSVIKLLLGKIVSNIAKGKSVFSTSLPVTIFEDVSLTQKICTCLGYAPLAFRSIISNPHKSEDLRERLKSIMIIKIGFSVLYIQQMAKPFNSVLGQTYQGQIDGCPVYAEQISHHPPITSFFMKGEHYFLSGSLQPNVSFHVNKIVGSNKGLVSVSFDDAHYDQNVMKFTFPETQMRGLGFGDRTIQRKGVSYIFYERQNIWGKIRWGERQFSEKQKEKSKSKGPDHRRLDYFQGSIYRLKKQVQVNKDNFNEITQNDIEKKLLTLDGNWLKSLFIQNKQQFNFQEYLPFECKQYKYPLPSHSNLRDDIKFKKLNEVQKSEQAKQVIEELQRHDRKMRQQFGYNE